MKITLNQITKLLTLLANMEKLPFYSFLFYVGVMPIAPATPSSSSIR